MKRIIRIKTRKEKINPFNGCMIPCEKWDGSYNLVGFDYGKNAVLVRADSNLYHDLPVLISYDASEWLFVDESGKTYDFNRV